MKCCYNVDQMGETARLKVQEELGFVVCGLELMGVFFGEDYFFRAAKGTRS